MDSPGSRGGVNRSGRRRRGRDRTGIAIGLIGFFLVRAAITYDSAQATGLDGALRRIADRSWGDLIVAVVGIGFVAHGVFRLATFMRRRRQAPWPTSIAPRKARTEQTRRITSPCGSPQPLPIISCGHRRCRDRAM